MVQVLFAGLLLLPATANAATLTVPATDDDGIYTVSWYVYPGSGYAGYTVLMQRFNGGSWTNPTFGSKPLGSQSHQITVTESGTYEYRVDYGYCQPYPGGCPMTTGSTAIKTTVVNLETNTPPTISNIGNQTINEDGNTGNIGFTVSDGETSAGSLTVTATSSNTTLVPNSGSNLTLGGSGGSRTIKVTPAPNKYGTATITVTVSDGAATASDTFVVTVNSVNDTPTISNIGNQTINEDGNTGNIAFTISDVETSTTSLTVTATSSNTTLVPNSSSNLTLGGSSGSRTIKVTPAANKHGTATITVTVSDGSLSASDTFVVTVNSINDLPTISAIGNVTLNEGASTGPISFTVSDVETAAASLTVTASSSNTILIPAGNITLGGSGASRTITVSARPYGGAGSSTITVTVSDGQASRNETFTVTVTDIPATLTVPATDSDGNGTYTISWVGGKTVVRVWEKVPGGSWVNLSASPPDSIDAPFGEKIRAHNYNGTYEYSLQDCYYEGSQQGGTTLHCNTTDTGSVVVSGINNAPTISNIGNKTINENGNTGNIAFTVSDPETAAGSLTVTATSSNTTLVPNSGSNLTLGGSGGNRTIMVTPAANQHGTATITVTVSDGTLSASDTFLLTVNGAPSISNIGNQTINEDGNTGNITFTVSDPETAAGSLTVTATSGNTTLVPNSASNLTLGGSGGNRTIKVTPATDKYGTATITVTVSDGAVTASDAFVVTVNSVNDAPTISNIGNRTISEDGNTGSIPFTVSDVETAAGSLTVTATSSNPTLVPNNSSNLALGGSGGSRTILVTPAANKHGTATITVTVSDGSLSASDTFVVTVNSVNDLPTISAIGNIALDEGVSSSVIPFTVGDVETAVTSLTVTAGSSNTNIIPIGNITLSGSGANRTIQVSAKPASGVGTSTITVTVFDGQASRNETLTVTVNNIPARLTIPATDSDGDGAYTISWLGGQNVTRVWEKAPGGSWVNLAGGSAVLGPYGELTRTQIQNGTYEYSLEDCYYEGSQSGTTLHCNATDTGSVVVSGVNSLPAISNIGNQTIGEGGSTNEIGFTVSDPETLAGSLTVTATSDNETLIPNNSSSLALGGSGGSRTIKVTPLPDKYGTATITVTVSDGQLSVSDTFTVTVNDIPAELTVPASDNDGTYTISWVGGHTVVRIWEKLGSGDWVNILPTGEFLPPYGSRTITHLSNGTYQYKIDDCYFEGSQQSGTTTHCATTDTGSIVVTLPVPTATAGFSPATISEGGSSTFSWSSTDANDCTATGIAGVSGTSGSIMYNASSTLGSNQTINATVTCTGYGGSDSANASLTVNWINDNPTISNIGNQTINEDGNTGDIAFTIGDEETAAGALIVTATSDNATLIPNGNITLGGSGANRTVRATPVTNLSGTATITVSVSDGVNDPVSEPFTVIVNSVNDIPTITSFNDLSMPMDTVTDELDFSISDVETPAASLTVTAYSSDTQLIPNSNLILGGSGGNRTLMAIPASGLTGIATITVEVSDGQASSSTSFDLSVVGEADPFDFAADAPPEFQYDLNDMSHLPNMGAGEFVALTQGAADVSNGAAQYTVPITLPPAINDLKPDLALSYNSQAGNGLMGVGWSLSGFSVIARCPPTYAAEGAAKAQASNPRYTDADRLCLDGLKLEIASSTSPANDSAYWATSAEYRTEIDSFTKIQAFDVHNGAHRYFKAWTRDGRILTYGRQEEGQNSRIFAPGQSNGPVSIWALDKVEDRYGNQYTVHYERNTAAGDYYPKHISFEPGASVVFSYVDRAGVTANGERSDMLWGYDMGHLRKHPKLLQTITTYIDVTNPASPSAGTPVREYELEYTRSPTTHRYRVSKIEECGFDGGARDCAKPLSLDWQAGELGFDFDAPNNILHSCSGQMISTTHLMVGDIDNDGYDDLFGGGLLYWGGPTCFTQAGAWATPGVADWKTRLLIATPRGKALLVTVEDPNSGSTPKTQFIKIIELDRATSTANSTQLNTTSVSPTTVVVLDLNNDGREDFLFGEHAWLQQNTDPVSFSPGTSNASLLTTGVCTPVEYNSDGLIDLFVYHHTPVNQEYSYTPIRARKNTGNGLFSSIEFSLSVSDAQVHEIATHSCASAAYFPGSMAYNLLDVNGDGKADYAYHRKPTGASDGTWYVGLNTGAGFVSAIDTGLSSGDRNNQYSYAYDWDKDGRQDLIVTNTTYDGWRVLMSTWHDGAPAFELAPNTDPLPGMGNLAGLQFANPQANILRGDFNHDGLVDVAIGVYVWYAKQQQPDLLKTVTDGFGAEVKFDYSPLVGDLNNGQPLYLPSSVKPVFPQRHAPRDMQVVKKLSTSDGLGGYRHLYFNYTGAKVDVQGRGFLGFEKIVVTDTTGDTVTTTKYRQDFPLIGWVSSVETRDGAGNRIAATDHQYAAQPHPQNSRFRPLEYSITRQYGLTTTSAGSPLSVTKTAHSFDQYGSLTGQTVTTGTGLWGTTVTGVKRIVTIDNTVITNNTTDWLLGFIEERTETTTEAGGANARSVTTEFDPEPGTLDVKVRRDFVGTPVWKTATTTRNANGVITGVSSEAGDLDLGTTAARTSTLGSFTHLIYPGTRTNGLGHQTGMTYDRRFGVVNSQTDPNNLAVTRQYDLLARLTAETGPDGTVTRYIRYECANAPVLCPAGATYLAATEVTNPSAPGTFGAPLTIAYFDMLQRKVRRETYSLDGAVVKVDTEYYADGRLKRVSEPYTGLANHWTVYSNYDALGRPHDVNGADGGSVHYDYLREGGLQKTVETVTMQTPEGSRTQTKTQYTNALGQVEQVLDDAQTPIDYIYDTHGNLKTTTVNNNAATTVMITHDVAGNKIYISDPDAGVIHFEYNGFGELRRQIWRKGTADEKSITYTYDVLGRKTGRTDTPVSGSPVSYAWAWDIAKKGRLDSRAGNGFTESYTYDSLARLQKKTTAISDLIGSKDFDYTYDEFGRPETVTYPDGFKVKHRYHAAGVQVQTLDVTGDPPNPKVLWVLGEDSDERGNLYRQMLGNGVMTERTLDAASGRLNRIQSGRLLGNSVSSLTGSVQDLTYEFDTLGNLYERATGRTDLNGLPLEYTAEIFSYDDLNRLKTSDTLWDSLDTRDRSYDYDELGNLTYRSDIGTLSYDQSNGAGVHAVTSANGQNYEYDAYGNMKKRGADTLEYDVFNKPTKIGNTYFSYGPDHERFKQVDGNRTTYYFGGGQYEEIIEAGVTTQRSHVGGYLVRNTSEGNTTLTYLHTDHLGSVEAMSDESGNFIGRMSFDPWGLRQDADWLDGNPTSGDPDHYPTTRGYTGHEMLDGVNLVHMNGRVYDPVIGRFLTPDILVQAPFNTQSYNRYSYVFNNPLSFVDPTGYCGAAMESYFSAMLSARIAETPLWMKFEGSVLPPVLTGQQQEQQEGYTKQELMEMQANNDGGETLREIHELKKELGDPATQDTSPGESLTPADAQPQAANQGSISDSLTTNGGGGSAGAGADSGGGFWRGLLNVLGKIWALPNTIIGAVYGGIGYAVGNVAYALGLKDVRPTWSIGNNALQFHNNPFMGTAMTFGNTIVYGSGSAYQFDSRRGSHTLGYEEMQHTFQAQVLGPLYFPAHLISGAAGLILNQDWHGSAAFLENGPHSSNPSPW